jgi:hypothetical protein
MNGSTFLGSAILANGVASLPYATLPTGANSITAVYSGDTNFNPNTSSPVVQTVTPAANQVVITWPTPAPITYGTPLSATQLNATATLANGASVAGKFVYTPKAGTVLNAGPNQTLSVTFTPTSKSYKAATATVPLTVNKVNTTTTITKATASKTNALAVTVSFTVAQAATIKTKPTGGVTVTASSGETCTDAALASGKGSCVLTFSKAESTTLTATYAGDSNNDGSTSTSFPLTVK